MDRRSRRAGSDVAGIRTTAVRDGDHYLVNGAKTFTTSGVRQLRHRGGAHRRRRGTPHLTPGHRHRHRRGRPRRRARHRGRRGRPQVRRAPSQPGQAAGARTHRVAVGRGLAVPRAVGAGRLGERLRRRRQRGHRHRSCVRRGSHDQRQRQRQRQRPDGAGRCEQPVDPQEGAAGQRDRVDQPAADDRSGGPAADEDGDGVGRRRVQGLYGSSLVTG